MADQDDEREASASDPAFAGSGPRRSSYTPPTSGASGTELHDDEELANALADDLARIYTRPVPVTPAGSHPDVDEVVTPADPHPVADAQAPTPPPFVVPSAADFEAASTSGVPHVASPTRIDASTTSAAREQPAPAAGAVFEESTEPTEPTGQSATVAPAEAAAQVFPHSPQAETAASAFLPSPPSATEPPAWTTAPAPDPAHAVPLDSPPRPPVRRSLPDDELARWVETAAREPGSSLEVIERLEAELQLRDEEAQEFRAWEVTMRALGTPEALASIEEARPAFRDVLAERAPSAAPAASVHRAPGTGAHGAPDAETDAPTAAAGAPGVERIGAPEPRRDREPDAAKVFEIPVIDAAAREDAVPIEPAEPVGAVEPVASVEPDAPDEPDAPVTLDESDEPVEREPVEPFELLKPHSLESDVPADEEAGHGAAVSEPVASEPPVVPEPPIAAPPVEPEAPIAPPPPLIEPPAQGEWPPSSTPAVFPFLAAEPGAPAPTPASVPSPSTFSFDDLLAGEIAADEEPLLRSEATAEATVEDFFIEPLPVTANDGIPTDTGTVRIIDRAYEEDAVDDAVDETDLAVPGAVEPAALVPVALPSGPIPTTRVPEHEVVIVDDEPKGPSAFRLEAAGLEPTLLEQRAASSMRLFWIWFSANSSILSLGLGAVVFAVGMSLRQAIVAVLAGVALSFLPLGLSTLAGKRSGQPTMVVSRASFGLLGNILPAAIALLSRVFWGAVLLWLLASSVVVVLVGARLDGGLGDGALLLIGLGTGLVIATAVAFVGYGLLARIQSVLGIISAVLIVGLIVLTAGRIDLDEALTNADGPWIITLTGAVLVFAFVGLVWAHSGADVARYQRADTSGAGVMLSSSFGATLPAFALIGYGALLAASDPSLAAGFVSAPLDTLARILPLWYPVPLLAATGLSLLSGLILTLYSGAFALQSLGLALPRRWSALVVAVLTAILAGVLAFGVGTLDLVFRDVATTLAVPTAAWVGIFAAELMIRNRRFASQSLLERGGVYADVNWTNTAALVAISAIGFGLTTASVSWLSWQGYLFALLGVPLDGELAGTDLGVLVALGLGLIVPLALGVRTIRRQEAIEL